jgi:hypothetical protein
LLGVALVAVAFGVRTLVKVCVAEGFRIPADSTAPALLIETT